MQNYRRCICNSRQVHHDDCDTDVFVRRYCPVDDRVNSIGNAKRWASERAADAAIHLDAIDLEDAAAQSAGYQ